ncbi:MAG: hypothetical protein V1874_12525 [Spirochaetota bacterium]
MPDFNVEYHNNLVDTLEKIADGAKLHSAEPEYPPEVTEVKLRKMKDDIELARLNYDQTISKAGQLFAAYDTLMDSIESDLARFRTSIYGHFGKTNKVVADFGLKPYKDMKGVSKPKKKKDDTAKS